MRTLFGVAAAAVLLAVAAVPALAGTTYPLSVDNCGLTVEIETPPQRVVTVKSTATEMLLALGLDDRIVGVAYQDGAVPAQWRIAAASLRVLSDRIPAQEVVLSLAPDFVYSGWESAFTGDGVGERASLAGFGVGTYVSPAACRTAPYVPPKLTFDTLFAQVREIGAIFDVAPAAEALVTRQRQTLEGIKPDTRGLSALWYSSGTRVPYVGAGTGAPELIMETVGLRNIMGATDETWVSASWEAIAAANPDVIVLVDAAWNSAAQKRRLLAENPVTRLLDAVVHERYLVVPFPASEAGVRTVDAAADLSRQLAALAIAL